MTPDQDRVVRQRKARALRIAGEAMVGEVASCGRAVLRGATDAQVTTGRSDHLHRHLSAGAARSSRKSSVALVRVHRRNRSTAALWRSLERTVIDAREAHGEFRTRA